MRVKLTLSYDGTDYCGWQVQNNGQTVQQKLEEALFAVTGERTRITGSGRTDAGVHASGQVAHFDTQSSLPAERFYKALNAHLPQDIRVLSSTAVADDFNACTTAKRKTYRYSAYLSDTELPLKERYAVRIYGKLDLANVRAVANELVGEHNFKAFSASGGGAKTFVRTVYSLDVGFNGQDLIFTVCGNGFLYNMVRIIVGTLVKAGRGELGVLDVRKMLETGERALGGETLPAKGLNLLSVEY